MVFVMIVVGVVVAAVLQELVLDRARPGRGRSLSRLGVRGSDRPRP